MSPHNSKYSKKPNLCLKLSENGTVFALFKLSRKEARYEEYSSNSY